MIRALALLPLLMLAACDLSMKRQPRYDVQAKGALFPDGSASQAPPAGVVETDDADQQASLQQPAAADDALLARGQDRFAVFCAPCHGAAGDGDGTVVKRGFPPPPSYRSARVLALSGQQIFDVVSNGYGVMYPYADRIPPHDRWAVVAYVRALQTAQNQPASALPPGVTPLEAGR